MKIGNLDDGIDTETIIVKKDGSVNMLHTQFIISYDENRTDIGGVGVGLDKLVSELKQYGDVHIAKDIDYHKGYTVLKAKDIAEVYSVPRAYHSKTHMRTIVPPKKGIRRIFAYLSNL
jgi:hypothetical protein